MSEIEAEGDAFPVESVTLDKGLSDRLREARDLLGQSQEAMNPLLGLGKKSWQKYETAVSAPGSAVLAALSRHGINVNWVLTGQGPKKISQVAANEIGVQFAILPQRDVDLSGTSKSFVETEPDIGRLAFRRDWLVKQGVKPSDCVLVRIIGDSMEPTLRDGGLVLVDSSVERPDRDGIYALMLDEGLVLKRVQRGFEGELILHSDNAAYRDIELTAEQASKLYLIGRAIWATGDL